MTPQKKKQPKNVARTKLGFSVPKIAPKTILWYAHVLRDAAESFMIKSILCTNASCSSIFFSQSVRSFLSISIQPSRPLRQSVVCVGLRSPQRFVLGFKTVAPQQYCQNFDVTHRTVRRKTTIGSLTSTTDTQNKGIAKLKPATKYQWALRDQKELPNTT